MGARVLAALAAPFAVGDPRDGAPAGAPRVPPAAVTVTACLGTIAVDGAADADAVLRHAGVALQRARAAQPGRLQQFTPALREETRAREAVAAALRGALDRTLQAERDGAPGGEFSLAFQPVVDLRTGAPTSVEALLRWRHPTLGPVSPATFIPLAEEFGLIPLIGALVLGAACVAIAGLHATVPAVAGLAVAVNVSGHQLQSGTFADEVAAALAANGLTPERLTVEVSALSTAWREAGGRAWPSRAPSWRSAGPSGCAPSARASRPRRSATHCARSAAASARATCSRARWASPNSPRRSTRGP